MSANNLTNKLKVFAINTTNKLDDATFNTDSQRISGYQPNSVISSKITNTVLRQTSIVTSALIEALKELSETNLTNSITFGSDTNLEDAKEAIKETLINTKVKKALLADNVIGGALVEETNIARKFKAGWQISQEFKEKMVFKGTWAGTYINNDIVYYSTAGINKGYYLIKGLDKESVNDVGVVTHAETLTILSSDTPTSATISQYLQRLTIESTIGADTSLSKVTSISSSSSDTQLPSAKAVYSLHTSHSTKKDNPHDVTSAQVGLENVTNDVQLKASDKVTTITSSSTDVQIPSAKSVYDCIETYYNSKTFLTKGFTTVSMSTTQVNKALAIQIKYNSSSLTSQIYIDSGSFNYTKGVGGVYTTFTVTITKSSTGFTVKHERSDSNQSDTLHIGYLKMADLF